MVHFPELNCGSNFQISLIQISVTLLQGHDYCDRETNEWLMWRGKVTAGTENTYSESRGRKERTMKTRARLTIPTTISLIALLIPVGVKDAKRAPCGWVDW